MKTILAADFKDDALLWFAIQVKVAAVFLIRW